MDETEEYKKMNRKNIAGSSPWEDIVGYSRMVVVDDCVEVAGTTAMKDGKVYAPGNAYEQRLVY